MFTTSFKTSVSVDGVTVSIPQLSVTHEAKAECSVAVPASSTTEIDVVFPFDVTVFVLKTDKAVTVKTNSSSVPDDTIALLAGGSKLFGTNGTQTIGTNPLTTDVTKLYVVNAGTDIANVEMRAGYDPTP
jgi:hypothetical protein